MRNTTRLLLSLPSPRDTQTLSLLKPRHTLPCVHAHASGSYSYLSWYLAKSNLLRTYPLKVWCMQGYTFTRPPFICIGTMTPTLWVTAKLCKKTEQALRTTTYDTITCLEMPTQPLWTPLATSQNTLGNVLVTIQNK